MISRTMESVETMLNSWRSKVKVEDGIADIRINDCMRRFSGDVISRACFESNYTKRGIDFLEAWGSPKGHV